jgi:hypothetical protein
VWFAGIRKHHFNHTPAMGQFIILLKYQILDHTNHHIPQINGKINMADIQKITARGKPTFI